jgi:hypothetical protein
MYQQQPRKPSYDPSADPFMLGKFCRFFFNNCHNYDLQICWTWVRCSIENHMIFISACTLLAIKGWMCQIWQRLMTFCELTLFQSVHVLSGLHVSTFIRQAAFDILYFSEFVILLGTRMLPKGSQRDVFCLGWPIEPSNMSPNGGRMGGGGGLRNCGVSANEYIQRYT